MLVSSIVVGFLDFNLAVGSLLELARRILLAYLRRRNGLAMPRPFPPQSYLITLAYQPPLVASMTCRAGLITFAMLGLQVQLQDQNLICVDVNKGVSFSPSQMSSAIWSRHAYYELRLVSVKGTWMIGAEALVSPR